MKSKNLLMILFLALTLALPSSGLAISKAKEVTPHEVHWGYFGQHGTENWPAVKSGYKTCGNGVRQSPINIQSAKGAKLPALKFNYKPTGLNIVNNGHTIKLNYAKGSYLMVGKDRYNLLQFHFHAPSEEQVRGRNFDMVAHLVHANRAGELAVVAVLFQKGFSNRGLRSFWDHLPKVTNEKKKLSSVRVNPTNMLPRNRSYYTFTGSLTTPPCTEGVRWFVLKNPVEFSPQQHAGFWSIYRNNNRPIQALNNRKILVSQ